MAHGGLPDQLVTPEMVRRIHVADCQHAHGERA
jgi:hypothetical protein